MVRHNASGVEGFDYDHDHCGVDFRQFAGNRVGDAGQEVAVSNYLMKNILQLFLMFFQSREIPLVPLNNSYLNYNTNTIIETIDILNNNIFQSFLC